MEYHHCQFIIYDYLLWFSFVRCFEIATYEKQGDRPTRLGLTFGFSVLRVHSLSILYTPAEENAEERVERTSILAQYYNYYSACSSIQISEVLLLLEPSANCNSAL